MTRKSQKQPLQVFFIYAHKDKRLRDVLDTHMSVFKREGVISTWYDGKIVPGQEWDSVIKENLKASRIFLLLVSPDFLASEYIIDKELKYALKMHDKATAVVVPIILRPCEWRRTRLKDLQALPVGVNPVTLWPNRDMAWIDVVQGIRNAVEGLQAKLSTVAEPLQSIPPTVNTDESSTEGDSSPVSLTPDPSPGATQPEIAIEAYTPVNTSLHQLRAPVSDFVGRQDEIKLLVQSLSKATESGYAAIVGIRGLGGIGKSELAYAVVQRLTDTYPDAQLLLELRGASDNPLAPEQALQTIIRAFEPLAQLPAELSGLRSAYLSLLSGKRVLILADDALDAKQVEALLPPPGCAMLLTSRQRFNLPRMKTVDLEVLSQLEAEKLLLDIYPAIGLAASRMAQLCGRLPLALRLSANLCANSTISIKDLLNSLESEQGLIHLRDLDDADMSVEASLRLTYDALDLPVQQVLCQLSIFPASFDKSAASAVVEASGVEDQRTAVYPQPLEELLDFLYRQSLLEWDRQTERYSLHNLVRVFALARLEGEEAVRMRHAQHYAQIATLADDLYQRGGENLLLGLKLFDQERTHIDAGWTWTQEQAGSMSHEVDRLLLDYANATIFIGDLRYDKLTERIPQIEAALEAAQRQGPREEESSALGNLGNAYADLGETRKAIQYYEQQLEIAREIGDRRGEGKALGNLGIAYRNLGETRRSIQYHEQQLEIARETGDRRGQSIALGNLGNAYADLGETRRSIQYHEQALQISREIGDLLGESSDLGNLGNAYADLGETRKAIQYYEQQLEIAREIGDRLGEGTVLGNLGIAYGNLGETSKAIQYCEQHLEIADKIGDRQGEARTNWNLGLMLAQKGDLARALELLQVLIDYEREIGHADAEKHVAVVEELRKELANKSP